MRTFPIVALASCGLIEGTECITADNPEATARIIEGPITGVGFIGGGAILQLKNSVRGTATAASIWSTGAIGIAVGLESYDVAFIISLYLSHAAPDAAVEKGAEARLESSRR